MELDNEVSVNLGETLKLIEEKKEMLIKRKKEMQWLGEPEVELDEFAAAKEAKKAEKLKAKGAKGKKK